MSAIEELLAEYDRRVGATWQHDLAAPQRVWFAVYRPEQERRLRLRIPEFETATLRHGLGWSHLDVTTAFAEWMASHEYRDAYFQEPELMQYALADFAESLARTVRAALNDADPGTVVALSGVASLFGITKVSSLIDAVSDAIRGRLLVFFPGDHDERNNFRFLDARDGWNYLASVIKARK
jgi:hypothetical protein